MIDELAEYEQQMKMTKNATVERMKNMMNDYYQNLKIEAKIEDQTGVSSQPGSVANGTNKNQSNIPAIKNGINASQSNNQSM